MKTSAQSWLPTYARNRFSRRKFLSGAAATGAAVAILTACGGGDSPNRKALTIDPSGVRQPGAFIYARDDWKLADETDQAVPGGILSSRRSSDLSEAPDPFLATVGDVEEFTGIVYEFLLRQNRGPGIQPATAEYRAMLPNLAESWEMANDAMSYTFTLRPGVKFHPIAPVNGREMKIDDWRASAERFIAVSSNRTEWISVVDKVEFPDSRRMVVKMQVPYVPLAARMVEHDFTFTIVPKELVDNPDLSRSTMIGTNYRILDKFQPSITHEFKRHDSYWAGKPFIERWHTPIIPESANAYGQFIAKNIISYSPSTREVLKTRTDVPDAIMMATEVNPTKTSTMVFGDFEKETAPWKDPRVRIALKRAVNWDGILELQSNQAAFAAAGVEIETAYTTHVPAHPDFYLNPLKGELGEASKNYLYDIAEAKKLLEAAGYPNGFDIDMFGLVGSEATANLVMDEYKKFGLIKVTPTWHPRQQFYADGIYAVNFKGIQQPFSAGTFDVDYILYDYYHSSGTSNAYSDPKLDELVQAQRKTADIGKRMELIKDFQRYLANTFYIVPGNNLSGGFRFEWPWLHNVNQAGHRQWLDPNMPRRNG